MNMRCCGGSSKIFSSALNAGLESMCTSSMMYTRLRTVVGREDCLVAQHAHIVHTVVGRRVQLDHVENGAVLNAAAGVALVAGVSVHRVLAVDRLGENARAGRFARAAGTDKKDRRG